MDFSRTVGTTAIKLTGMTVPPVSNQRWTNSDCSIRQTRFLFLPTQAYNSSHFYTVRLVWFSGYMGWERRKYTWEIRGQKWMFAERRQCVSLVVVIIVITAHPHTLDWTGNKHIITSSLTLSRYPCSGFLFLPHRCSTTLLSMILPSSQDVSPTHTTTHQFMFR